MLKKQYAKPMLLLTAAGLALNVSLVWLVGALGLPVYMDSFGTVAVAVLGGTLPGMFVGFVSNCLTTFLAVTPDPMTLYYGFLNVLIAVVAAWLSRKGLLVKWYGKVIAVFAFAFIGGALGSMVTWVLYGFSFGQGVSAPLAGFYYNQLHWGEFPAQFVADMSVDLLDKSIVVLFLELTLRFLPAKAMAVLPKGARYLRSREKQATSALAKEAGDKIKEGPYRKRSINTKITLLLIISSTILSLVALVIGVSTYRQKLVEQATSACNNAVKLMDKRIDGDRVADYLFEGETAEGYAETEAELQLIFDSVERLQYMYVYAIWPDGCHVVFDLDTPDLPGEPPGSIVPFDETFPYLDEVLAGEPIPPVITNDTYGWLLTVYHPVYDRNDRVVAYAAVDMDMLNVRTDMYTFSIGILSLLFGVLILITSFSLWYCDKTLLEPINVLTTRARDFHYGGDGTTKDPSETPRVKTGDELEELFDTLCLTEEAVATHLAELERKNVEISQMQRNIIFTLANMVENRDSNTGGHIRRTASYVRLIARKLRDEGRIVDTPDEAYIKRLYDSAPLHDIGKIRIPDAILNKPGRLTKEEFDVMKTHAALGREILLASLQGIEESEWLSIAVDMAAFHHERWDGTGYPEGLKGEQIPLCARIMAVSDVFDALVTVRSYKSAFPFDKAMAILQDEAGTHFDPNIVRVFVASKDEIHAIIEME